MSPALQLVTVTMAFFFGCDAHAYAQDNPVIEDENRARFTAGALLKPDVCQPDAPFFFT
jgi:hypothetical protein